MRVSVNGSIRGYIDDVTKVMHSPWFWMFTIECTSSLNSAPMRWKSLRTKAVVNTTKLGGARWLITQPSTSPLTRIPTLEIGSARASQIHGSSSGSIHGCSALVFCMWARSAAVSSLHMNISPPSGSRPRPHHGQLTACSGVIRTAALRRTGGSKPRFSKIRSTMGIDGLPVM